MTKNFLKLFCMAIIASTIFTACDNTKTTDTTETDTVAVVEETPVMEEEVSNDVVDVAISSPDHTTLVAAVKASGLVETLKGDGPFTVFAPTNAAFSALPEGTVESLLTPEKKADLSAILTYHVVAGSVMAADLTDGQKVTTVQGEELTVSIKDGKVMINGANVTTADLSGSNGVVHVIDAVLMPKK